MYGILNGKEKSSLSLFIDDASNYVLRSALINELCKKNSEVVIFCHHESPQWYQKTLAEGNRVHYFDGHSDPFNWISSKDEESSSSENIKSQILADVSNSGASVCYDGLLIIDDIIIFGRSRGLIDSFGNWNDLLQIIVDISCKMSICILLNSKLVKEGDVRSLMYKSSFYCKLINEGDLLKRRYKCQSVLKKISGKVSAEISYMQLGANGGITLSKKEVETIQESEEVDPASNLTFNLRLTDIEREARANTALPYILKDINKAALLNPTTTPIHVNFSGGGGGEVIYTPDDLDDFDDEDPDDDLDI